MKLALTGSSGLLGTAIRHYAASADIDVKRIVRDKPDDRAAEAYWDYKNELFDWTQIEDCDIVIHLAGRPLVDGKWNRKMREEIRHSRVKSTQFLSQCIAQMPKPPKLFITASAIGYYGDREDEILTEESGLGEGFLSDVCKDWEAATGAVKKKGETRVAHLRLAMVISGKGGALPMMLTPFKLGVGGKLGSGKQYMSWIALPDVIRAIQFIIATESISGPVNLAAPNPVTNATFTDALGHVLHRPTVLSVPAAALKLRYGDMAREMLLSSARVLPKRLTDAGFTFELTTIQEALKQGVNEDF